MVEFVDPRVQPEPPFQGKARLLATDRAEVAELIASIDAGRFYDVERWVSSGAPIQFRYPENRRKSPKSPLQAAIRTGQHDVVHLLLCNGYQTELERKSPYTEALRAGCHHIVHLLFDWGVDPHPVDTWQVVDCYDGKIVEAFWRRGVDLGAVHALGETLAFETTNRPLYGFAKRCCGQDPVLQRELNLGLCLAVEEQKERGIAMCLWAGADPWTPAPDLRYRDDDYPEDWTCAVERAVSLGRHHLLGMLKVSGEDPGFQGLYQRIDTVSMFDALRAIAPPNDLDAIFERAIGNLVSPIKTWMYEAEDLIPHILKTGGRLTRIEDWGRRAIRQYLLRRDRYYTRKLVRLLQDPEFTDESVFLQIIRSPKVIEQHREVGITKQSLKKLLEQPGLSSSVRAAARRMARPVKRRRYRQ